MRKDDKLATPKTLWLTSAKLEARKTARDQVIAIRRAKRRAQCELDSRTERSRVKPDHPSRSARAELKAKANSNTNAVESVDTSEPKRTVETEATLQHPRYRLRHQP